MEFEEQVRFDPSIRTITLKNSYDILIVGAGIYGATLSYIAAQKGYQVLLVEKNDYASGTSSNSLKILHGGIRYLQSFDLVRVIESAKERARLTSIAPHLVRPITCILPLKASLAKNKLFIYIALNIFDFIRKIINQKFSVYKHDKSRILSAKVLSKIYANISLIKSSFALCWQDSQVISTERMVYKFCTLSKKSGSDTYNYLKFKSSKKGGGIHAVRLLDELTGQTYDTSASVIIDATSSWQFNKSCQKNNISYVSAVNLVINKKFSNDTLGIPFVKERVNRTLFLSPWNESTLIGTWYFNELTEVNDKIVRKCLDDVHAYIPELTLTKEDISFIHHGKLPANKVKVENPYLDIQNQYKILDGESKGMFVVQGVKFTTAMDVAEKTLSKVGEFFTKTLGVNVTSRQRAGRAQSSPDIPEKIHEHIYSDISAEVVKRLNTLYGDEALNIINLARTNMVLQEYVPSSKVVLKAEIMYLLEKEEVFCLSDLLLRRTDIGTQGKPSQEMIKYCANTMRDYFKWDSDVLNYNLKELDNYYPSWVK